jgi:tetratricopeptide (TPR) repeat protein
LAGLAVDLSRRQLAARSPDRAFQSARRALRLYQTRQVIPGAESGIARAIMEMANAYRDLDRTPEAKREFHRASEMFEDLAKGDPSEPTYRRQVGRADFEIGKILDGLGHRPEAIAAYRRSLRSGRELILDYPLSELDLAEAVATRIALASALKAEGHRLRAGIQYFLAIRDQAGLVVLSPGISANRRELERLEAALVGIFRERSGLPSAKE